MRIVVAKSSVIYRVYATLIDLMVAVFLLNIMKWTNALILTAALNVVKIGTYYFYHNIFIKFILRRFQNE